MTSLCPNADRCDEMTCGCPEVREFRTQLDLDESELREPIEGEVLPAPDPQRAFRLGYSVGRSSVEAEAAADRIFRRARSRRLLREAVAVGAAWLVGSALGEWIGGAQ